MWILVVMVFVNGGYNGNTPAVAVNSLSGFRSEAVCKIGANKLHIDDGRGRQVLTFCLSQD